MKTKAEIKSEKYGLVLDNIINPNPIEVIYPKLEGTGIQFFTFVFNQNTTMLSLSITPQLLKQFPIKDQNKYTVDISNKKAFTYRIVNGETCSPAIEPNFVKCLEDLNYYTTYKTFKYINDWVMKNHNKWVFNN